MGIECILMCVCVCVCVAASLSRGSAEIPEQLDWGTRSPASKPCRSPGNCWELAVGQLPGLQHTSPALPQHAPWIGLAPCKQSEETPGPSPRSTCDPSPRSTCDPDWFPLNPAGSREHCTLPQKLHLSTPPSPACFSWVKVTLINVIHVNHFPLPSNCHMAR